MRALSVLFVLAAAPAAAQYACSEDRVSVVGEFGRVNFEVEVADDAEERAQGLMFVEEMPTLDGMLFVYDRPQRTAFWMRNTLIPLDMIFAGADGTIRRIHANAVPMDETSIPGGDDIQFVLEINGGLAARLGIAEGDALQHPAIGDGAALPCD
ncbi:DUF192 domain-containing protein [Wenxinia saemankumensis]|nr:DUF192 domain-containing protein [Wenxinia saemankumensis]